MKLKFNKNFSIIKKKFTFLDLPFLDFLLFSHLFNFNYIYQLILFFFLLYTYNYLFVLIVFDKDYKNNNKKDINSDINNINNSKNNNKNNNKNLYIPISYKNNNNIFVFLIIKKIN